MPARRAMRLAAVTGALLTLLSGTASAQDRWAAIAPNQENSSNVVWATTKEQAKELAVLACKQSSKTCADTPASHQRHGSLLRGDVLHEPQERLRRGRRRRPRQPP